MTLQEIKDAVDAGKIVHWMNDGYIAHKGKYGQYLVTFKANDSAIGLTWSDGVTLNGSEDEFYIAN